MASMTLHHGANGSCSRCAHHAPLHVEHEVEDAACTQECSVPSHSIPACCGMGLCLSGLPVTPQAEQYPPRRNATGVLDAACFHRSFVGRIDRPPKISDRDEL